MNPLLAGAIIAPVMGGIMGAGAASKKAREAAQQRELALQLYGSINVPTITEQELQLNLPEYLGGYDANLETALNLAPSSMEGLSTDPRLQQAQMAALQQLSEIGQTGMTPAEAAALRTARRGAAGEAEAKSQQILQEMQRRGAAGSGMELAARLQAAQSGADRQSQESDRAMQMAQARALQALSQSGSLAGQIRGQEFGEKSDIARAQDAIKAFNIQNQQQVGMRNVQAENQARLRNLQEQQRIGEAKTGIQNQQQIANKNLIQQQFQNQMQRASGMAGQYQAGAQAAQQTGANLANMYAQIGSGVGTGLAAFAKPQTKEV